MLTSDWCSLQGACSRRCHGAIPVPVVRAYCQCWRCFIVPCTTFAWAVQVQVQAVQGPFNCQHSQSFDQAIIPTEIFILLPL